MADLRKHQSNTTTKLLLVGKSGTGKTGSLCSLAADGWKVRILDFDNGLDIVKNLLLDQNGPYFKKNPDAIDNISYISLTEKMKKVGNTLVPAKAEVWIKAMEKLDSWKDDDHNFGSIYDWDSSCVLVIDSFSQFSQAALDVVLAMNARLGQKPFQSDWGQAQSYLESFLQKIKDVNTRCNVILCCHIKYIGKEEEEENAIAALEAYPNTLGKALPPKIATYFNSTLLMTKKKMGAKWQNGIVTNTSAVNSPGEALLGIKTTMPNKIPSFLPVEWGLANYFRCMRNLPLLDEKGNEKVETK